MNVQKEKKKWKTRWNCWWEVKRKQ